jgi:reactive intermediate/imine deaminase
MRVVVITLSAWLAVAGHAAAQQGSPVEFFNSGTVLPASLPFSEAVLVGDVLYLSGQVGITPGTMQLVPGGIRAEAKQAMENVQAILGAHGFATKDLVKCTAMLVDMSEWATFNEVYATFFKGRFPARSALGVNGLALGARVEVECIAARSR